MTFTLLYCKKQKNDCLAFLDVFFDRYTCIMTFIIIYHFSFDHCMLHLSTDLYIQSMCHSVDLVLHFAVYFNTPYSPFVFFIENTFHRLILCVLLISFFSHCFYYMSVLCVSASNA